MKVIGTTTTYVGEEIPGLKGQAVRIFGVMRGALRADVNAGKFRADLYFRLAVVRVTVPPLRERLADLPLIAHALLGELGATPGSHPALFEETFLSSLSRAVLPSIKTSSLINRCPNVLPQDSSSESPLRPLQNCVFSSHGRPACHRLTAQAGWRAGRPPAQRTF